jgi:uncharacterized membrane protein YbhN (UPF0104 family)
MARSKLPRYPLGVLERIRVSKWVRAGLLVVVLAFCSYGLVHEWPGVHPALSRLHWYSVAGALAAAMASAGCMMLAWRRLLTDLGSKLPVPVAARVTFIAQMGKYVPGAIWSVAAHIELGYEYDVPRRRGAASVMIWIAGLIAVGLLIAAACLPLSHPAIARRYLLFLAAIPVIAICLAPPVLHRLLNFALKIIRREGLEQQVTWRGLGGALAWIVIGWVLLGIQVWLLLADVANNGFRSILLALGAYALACSLALLLVVFPNGIGAREVILAAALAPVIPHGAALAVALVARVVTTVSDLAWGGIALGLARSARHSRSTTAASSATATAGVQAGRHVGKHRKVPVTRQPAMTPVASAAEQGTP